MGQETGLRRFSLSRRTGGGSSRRFHRGGFPESSGYIHAEIQLGVHGPVPSFSIVQQSFLFGLYLLHREARREIEDQALADHFSGLSRRSLKRPAEVRGALSRTARFYFKLLFAAFSGAVLRVFRFRDDPARNHPGPIHQTEVRADDGLFPATGNGGHNNRSPWGWPDHPGRRWNVLAYIPGSVYCGNHTSFRKTQCTQMNYTPVVLDNIDEKGWAGVWSPSNPRVKLSHGDLLRYNCDFHPSFDSLQITYKFSCRERHPSNHETVF